MKSIYLLLLSVLINPISTVASDAPSATPRITKKFKCEQVGCDKFFDRKAHLNRHMITHDPSHWVACKYPGCNRIFARNSVFRKNHQKMHSEPRLYPCSFCSYVAIKKNHLSAHISRHKGERPHVCGHANCHSAFTAKSDLFRHLKNVHKGGIPDDLDDILAQNKLSSEFDTTDLSVEGFKWSDSDDDPDGRVLQGASAHEATATKKAKIAGAFTPTFSSEKIDY